VTPEPPGREEGTTESRLLERVKELTCLYSIARVAAEPDLAIGERLQRIVELLPPAWRFPDLASARISAHGVDYETRGFRMTPLSQRAEIPGIDGKHGEVAIVYREPAREADEGPFLREERNLLNAVASEIGLILDRSRIRRDRENLTEQLRHAERLSTIGQLAAGVAHELNEPLAGILGLAQLAIKSPDLPEPVLRDLERIVKSALDAREIIRNLLLFARRMPPAKKEIRLNDLVEDALKLVEPRRLQSGVDLVRALASDLPEIAVDPSQIRQVLVNLLVNALQAMSHGVTLEVRTGTTGNEAFVVVADTGAGMSGEVLEQLYVPFFTTKDVGQGTGLGLPVAAGIVSSHGGTIHAESEMGRGSRFEVRLPIGRRRA
jgi:signal transduction histidine kinase